MLGRDDTRNVAEQNAAYRRGVVLGLTMAEVGILIIFVLLLLIGFNEWTRIREREESSNKTAIPTDRLTQLEAAEARLAAIAKAMSLPDPISDDQIQILVRALQEAATTPAGQSALREAREILNEIRRVKNELPSTGESDGLREAVERQSFRIANQEGQMKHLESQLQSAGLGKGERPCWVKPDGTIEFLFDVVLATNGIRMRENVYANRDKERSTLPMPQTDPAEVLSPGEFLKRTEPLYKSSLAANCRFFVTIFDATGPTEKDHYKFLLRTVEGHFYKRLSFDAAPF